MKAYDINEQRRIAVYKATSQGYPEIAEDFAQDALFRLWQGRKATFYNLLTDFLRTEYGDTRHTKTEEGRSRYQERKNYMGLDEVTLTEEPTDSNINFYDLLKTLEAKERAYIVLAHKWGFNLQEIADCFGVSEGRVSQELSQVNQKILRFIQRAKECPLTT